MSIRVDSSSLIAGAVVCGHRGLGVLGSAVPSTGDQGPGYLYPGLSLPADANKEVRGLIVTPPSTGIFVAYEDSSFTLTGAPNGSYGFVFRLYVDGVDQGTATATVNIGPVDLAGNAAVQASVAAALQVLKNLAASATGSAASSASS